MNKEGGALAVQGGKLAFEPVKLLADFGAIMAGELARANGIGLAACGSPVGRLPVGNQFKTLGAGRADGGHGHTAGMAWNLWL